MESSNTGGSKNDTEIDGVGDGDNFGEPGADPKTQNFTEGEKVLAYHGPCLYEAKVQKAEQREDEWRYFVHYQGWSKNWDEWMDTDRLLKVTEENVRMQHALAKKQKTEKGSKAAKSMQNKPKSSNDAKLEKEEPKNAGVKGKKRKGQYGPEEKDTKSVDKFTLVQFPLTLKKQLVDDWQFVTQLGKGGWENDETDEEAAVREAMEEAGVKGELKEFLGEYEFRSKSHQDEFSPEGCCKAHMFALHVNEVLDCWPEQNTRSRRWLTISDAALK